MLVTHFVANILLIMNNGLLQPVKLACQQILSLINMSGKCRKSVL